VSRPRLKYQTARSSWIQHTEIREWKKDEITVKESEAECTTTGIHINRTNQTVTMTRVTKQPKSDNCAGISDEPIFLHLGHGFSIRR
jgi:hypothetical protein